MLVDVDVDLVVDEGKAASSSNMLLVSFILS